MSQELRDDVNELVEELIEQYERAQSDVLAEGATPWREAMAALKREIAEYRERLADILERDSQE